GSPVLAFDPSAWTIGIPTDLATDAAGDVFSNDNYFSNILKFTSSGTLLNSWNVAAPGSDALRALACDVAGNVYVTDRVNNRIMVYDNSGNYLRQWSAVSPGNIAVDPVGNVYVAQQSDTSVTKFGPTGAQLLHWGTSGSLPGRTGSITRICADAAGHVFVA